MDETLVASVGVAAAGLDVPMNKEVVVIMHRELRLSRCRQLQDWIMKIQILSRWV